MFGLSQELLCLLVIALIISGLAEIMKSGSADDKTMLSFSEDIYNEAQRLILLVNDILKLSKLDEESITMKKEEICIEETCAETIKSLESYAKKKKMFLLNLRTKRKKRLTYTEFRPSYRK